MSTTFKINDGDVVLRRGTGQVELVSDGLKLRQDLRAGLATAARPENIGAGLEDVVNGRATNASILTRQVQRGVRVMVANMRDLQGRFQRGQRPNAERLVSLATLEVSQVQGDPTAFYFRAEFISGVGAQDPVYVAGRLS